MSDGIASSPLIYGPIAMALGAGGGHYAAGLGEQLAECQPLIVHAVRHEKHESSNSALAADMAELKSMIREMNK